MKRIVYLLSTASISLLFLLSLVFVSCGPGKGHFQIEGRLLHINSGELYVYSPDGGIDGMDTIKIDGGRFAYETVMPRPATLVLVFPNFSEHPIFAESGESVELKADASHLKEMTVTGTKDNELMNGFREQVANASPPEEKKYAELFIKDHPESLASVYLIRKYFIISEYKDYDKAAELAGIIAKAQPENVAMGLLQQQLASLAKLTKGKSLPAFSATDIYGKKITNADLKAEYAVISVWASWAYETYEMQRLISDAVKESDGKIKAIGICIDGDKEKCKESIERSEIAFPNICDGMMINSKLLKDLGIGTAPYNIFLHNGKITDMGISIGEIREKLEKMKK